MFLNFRIQFTFSKKVHEALVVVDYKIEPCYLFIYFNDGDDLVKEFGPDISIETDLEKVLPMDHSYPDIDELRLAIFEAVKKSPEFEKIKLLYPNSKGDCDPKNKPRSPYKRIGDNTYPPSEN